MSEWTPEEKARLIAAVEKTAKDVAGLGAEIGCVGMLVIVALLATCARG